MPEEAHFYNYLSAEEFLVFCGKLFQIPRKKEVAALLELAGLQGGKKVKEIFLKLRRNFFFVQ